jgi:ubiquinone/menaquinone biosynthesis C-methylase UbiE
MSCHGHFFVEDAVRRRWHKPEVILKEIGLGSGMVFMDIGSGDGFFTIPAAGIVGKRGTVYAVDIDASAIERLKRKAAEKGLGNVNANVAAAEETIFCEGCADIVFYSIVLHDLKDPAKVLRNARRMLKPAGKLVDLDWKKKPTVFGPPVQIRFSEGQARALMENAGFKVESVRDAGRNHYLITAKP